VRLGLKEAGLQKLGTDEQKPYRRHNYLGKQSHHCNALKSTKMVVM